ncbi:hypothetical protein BJ165DRAFT_1527644 [Panaeolus papilionaceus]|nr:hypothetical protein BJ165DRAFT_1527644 [Panaeolus papilionaceus]
MGGSAFSERLSAAAFPRLPPPVYCSLKARLLPLLQQHYSYVGVPEEEPEKLDHGDIDFIVAEPRDPTVNQVPHQIIQEALGACDVIVVNGNPTTNYAIPVEDGEWAQHGFLDLENGYRTNCDGGKIYYQVDVHVCPDRLEWQYILYTHSYGCLNSSLGLLARKNGLSFGAHGLKVEVAKRENYLRLTQSFEDVLQFFGLSFETYKAGFSTKDDIFKWLATSKYFDVTLFSSDCTAPNPRKSNIKLESFYHFVARQAQSTSSEGPETTPVEDLEARKKRVVNEALEFFDKYQAYLDKWQEYEKQQADRRLADAQRLKQRKLWSGSRVHDWAAMNGYWLGVKKIMDVIRKRLGGDDAIIALIDEQGEESVRALVIQVRDELGIVPRPPDSVSTPTIVAPTAA